MIITPQKFKNVNKYKKWGKAHNPKIKTFSRNIFISRILFYNYTVNILFYIVLSRVVVVVTWQSKYNLPSLSVSTQLSTAQSRNV